MEEEEGGEEDDENEDDNWDTYVCIHPQYTISFDDDGHPNPLIAGSETYQCSL